MSGATDNDLGNLCPNPECKTPFVDTYGLGGRGWFVWCQGCGMMGPQSNTGPGNDAVGKREAWRLWGLLFTDQTARLPTSD